jgi:hypothetical protein
MIPLTILWSLFGIVLFVGIFLKHKDKLIGDVTTKNTFILLFLVLISGPAIWIYIILFWIYTLIEKSVSSLLNK